MAKIDKKANFALSVEAQVDQENRLLASRRERNTTPTPLLVFGQLVCSPLGRPVPGAFVLNVYAFLARGPGVVLVSVSVGEW